jgi:hypothetical protein
MTWFPIPRNIPHAVVIASDKLKALDAEARIAAHAKRLALELECLLLDTEDTAVVSKWWDSANEALAAYQAEVDAVYRTDSEPPANQMANHAETSGSLVVYKAIARNGETAHFGVYSAAKAWARSGTVEKIPIHNFQVVANRKADVNPESIR